MTNSFIDISSNASDFFNAFNILNMGLVAVWIIGSIFLANAISERKDERALVSIIFIMFGGLIIFANDPAKYVMLIVAVCFVIYGFFKMLHKRKEFNQ